MRKSSFHILVCSIFAFLFSLNSFAKASPECRKWFSHRKIKPTKDRKCVNKCETIEANFLSYACYFECESLCGFDADFLQRQFLLDSVKNITIYYDLNEYELDLILKDPATALRVYLSKNKAEVVASTLFKRNDRLDESDAARHFAWAFATCMDIGYQKAKAFLDAHERTDEAVNERAMDVANNYRGLEACKKIKQARPANNSPDQILLETIAAYKSGKLIVLKPKEVTKNEKSKK